MEQVFGWWLTSPDRKKLLNRLTGQRLQLVEPLRPRSGITDESELRFIYEDDEIDYPIVARWSPKRGSPAGSKKNLAAYYNLHVDHVRSAALWRQSTGASDSHPPYGLWRRVDDCLTDALACWPRIKALGTEASKVMIRGGWSNGVWRPDFCRAIDALTEKDREVVDQRRIGVSDHPSLLPISVLPPSPWRFHGFPEDGYLSSLVNLSGLKKKNEFRLHFPVWVVPFGIPLRGLAGRTAYLATEDGQRVFHPKCGTDASAAERGPLSFTFQYVDEDFSVTLRGVNKDLPSGTGWTFNITSVSGAHRAENVEDDLWIQSGAIGNIPSYALWRRLSWAILDAWLYWEGTDARCSSWAEELTLAPASSVSIAGQYLGGRWPNKFFCAAWLDDVAAPRD